MRVGWTVSSSAQESQIHWLFKATGSGVFCLGIQVFADGDYRVIHSPTGTYLAGHADRGKWRLEHDRYVGQGYVPESEAKAAGLIPESWNKQPPPPPWVRKKRIARVVGLAVLMILGAGVLWLVR
jgi:hypothetical protein